MSYLKKFLSYYRPYRGAFALVLLAAAAASGISLTYPLFIRYITDRLLTEGADDAAGRILLTGAIMLLLLGLQTAFNYWQDYRGHAIGAQMERDVRRELFAHVQKMSFSFFDRHQVGELLTRLTDDLLWLTELYHHGPEDILISLTRFVGAAVILSFINPRLTLLVFAFLPPMTVFVLIGSSRMRRAIHSSRERISEINGQLEEAIAGIRVVQSFVREDTELQKFDLSNKRFLESRKAIYRAEAQVYQGVELFTRLCSIAAAVFGGLQMLRGRMGLSGLLSFMLYIGYLTEPIQKLMNTIELYQRGFAGFDRFIELMELEPEIADLPQARLPDRVREGPVGAFTFEQVGFHYPGNTEQVLQGLLLQIESGETVALVGPSGVGKTTFCSLLPRFYEPSEGRILLDGQDIRTLPLAYLREQIGVVSQDTWLFSGSVMENIRYGNPHADEAEVRLAARRAFADAFIRALPDGYQTDIGPHGLRLSGGQRQRLAIARAFLKNPPILILDEATSALDTESEAEIQRSLRALCQGRTTFIIAHRLSTIREAGRILVLSEGRIVESGTHEQLMQSGGLYSRLYHANA